MFTKFLASSFAVVGLLLTLAGNDPASIQLSNERAASILGADEGDGDGGGGLTPLPKQKCVDVFAQHECNKKNLPVPNLCSGAGAVCTTCTPAGGQTVKVWICKSTYPEWTCTPLPDDDGTGAEEIDCGVKTPGTCAQLPIGPNPGDVEWFCVPGGGAGGGNCTNELNNKCA